MFATHGIHFILLVILFPDGDAPKGFGSLYMFLAKVLQVAATFFLFRQRKCSVPGAVPISIYPHMYGITDRPRVVFLNVPKYAFRFFCLIAHFTILECFVYSSIVLSDRTLPENFLLFFRLTELLFFKLLSYF